MWVTQSVCGIVTDRHRMSVMCMWVWDCERRNVIESFPPLSIQPHIWRCIVRWWDAAVATTQALIYVLCCCRTNGWYHTPANESGGVVIRHFSFERRPVNWSVGPPCLGPVVNGSRPVSIKVSPPPSIASGDLLNNGLQWVTCTQLSSTVGRCRTCYRRSGPIPQEKRFPI